MKPTPVDWPRLSSALMCKDASAAIDWLVDAFGFELRLKVEGEGGKIEHSELTYGEAVVMVAQDEPDGARPWKRRLRAPSVLDGQSTQSLMLYVDDVDAHCARARAKGASILEEPTTHDYGDDYWSDRSYGAVDPEGHVWWITQRLRSRTSA